MISPSYFKQYFANRNVFTDFLFVALTVLLPIIVYLPYFQNFIPFINYDSFIYYLVVDSWISNPDYQNIVGLDLPLGYPYFLFLLEFIGASKVTIVVIQLLLFFIPFSFFCYKIFSFSKRAGLLVVFFGFLLFFDNDWIVHSLTFKPDFIFTIVMSYIAYLVVLTKDWSVKRLVLLNVFVASGIAIRSNGVLLLLFLLVPLFFSFNRETIFKSIISFLTINSIFILVSLGSAGYIAHGSLYRVYQEFFDEEIVINSPNLKKWTNLEKLNVYINPLERKRTFFYNSTLSNMVFEVAIKNKYEGCFGIPSYSNVLYGKCYPESTKELTVGENYTHFKSLLPFYKDEYDKLTDFKNSNIGLMNKFTSRVEFIHRKIDIPMKFVVYIISVLYLIWCIIKWILKKNINVYDAIVFAIVFFHLISVIFLVYVHHRPVMRYVLPTETVFYLLFPLIISKMTNIMPLRL